MFTSRQKWQSPIVAAVIVGLTACCLLLVARFAAVTEYTRKQHPTVLPASFSSPSSRLLLQDEAMMIHPCDGDEHQSERWISSSVYEGEEAYYNATAGFCARVPADRSAGYLWKKKRTNQPSSLRRYRNGIRGRPLPMHWNRFLERIDRRLQWLEQQNEKDATVTKATHSSIVQIVLVVVGPFVSVTPRDLTAKLLGAAMADFALFFAKTTTTYAMDDVFSVNVIWPESSSNVKVDSMTGQQQRLLDRTTDDAMIRKLTTAVVEQQKPHDLVILASAGESLAIRHEDESDILDYQARVRSSIQDFIAAASSWTKHDNGDGDSTCSPKQPPLLLWDLFEGINTNVYTPETTDIEGMDANSLYRRVLQQLADYYQIGYLALPSYSTEHRTTDSLIADNLALLRYSMLQFTVDSCSSSQSSSPHPISSLNDPYVLRRIESVPPPRLDDNTSLLTISQAWKQQEQARCLNSTA
jgi:hypothetical protein